jgi:hypothetical protein
MRLALALFLVLLANARSGADTLADCTQLGSVQCKSAAGDPADSGLVRLGNTEFICWEANPAGSDVCMTVGTDNAILVPSLNISGTLATLGDISPSSLSSDQNNWNPTSLSTAAVIRVTASTPVNITGLSGGTDGRIIRIVNINSVTVFLKDESASSTAANRFALVGDMALGQDQGVTLLYDSTTTRWRSVGRSLLLQESGISRMDPWVINFTDNTVSCSTSTGVCDVGAGTTVVHQNDGSLGAGATWRTCSAGGIDAGGTCLEVPNGTGPAAADCDASGEEGRLYENTSDAPGARMDICTGTGGWEWQAGRMDRTGGSGGDGAFTMTPGTSGSCTAGDCDDSCTTCTGTRPACVCTLPPNSYVARHALDGTTGSTMYSCWYEFTTGTLTAGTVVCGSDPQDTALSPTFGAQMVLRFQQTPNLVNGTISMVGRGAGAGTAGTNSASTGTARNGGGGGPSSFVGGGANGVGATPTPGTAGTNVLTNPRLRPYKECWGMGAGGGGGAGNGGAGGGANGASNAFAAVDNFCGAPGGGGGGCTGSAANGAGSTGGRGGGGLWIETAGTWTGGNSACTAPGLAGSQSVTCCTGSGTGTCSLTLTTAGNPGSGTSFGGSAGKAGGGGGGGGNIELFYRKLGGETGITYTTSGGNAGTATDGTNCRNGGAGGNGQTFKYRVPF